MSSMMNNAESFNDLFAENAGRKLLFVFEDYLNLLPKKSIKYAKAKRFIQLFTKKMSKMKIPEVENKSLKETRVAKAKLQKAELMERKQNEKRVDDEIAAAAKACIDDDDADWSEISDNDEPPAKKLKVSAIRTEMKNEVEENVSSHTEIELLSDDDDDHENESSSVCSESGSSSSDSDSSSSDSDSSSSSSENSSESDTEGDDVPATSSRRQKLLSKNSNQQKGGGQQKSTDVSVSAKIINDEKYSHDRFNRDVYTTTYEVSHNLNEVDILSAAKELDTMFGNFVNDKIARYSDNDIICVTITHEKLSDIFINKKKKNFDIEDIATAIAEVSQSNQTFLLDGILTLEVQVVKEKIGSGKLPVTVEKKRKNCHGLIQIKNKDNSCGYMAIALAYYYHEHRNDDYNHEKKCLRMNSGGCLKTYARELFDGLNINIENPLGMDDIKIISDFLNTKNVKLIVVNGHLKTKDFEDDSVQGSPIYVELYNNHYNTISAINKYFGKWHFCSFCWTAYDKLSQHRCKSCCEACQEAKNCAGDKKKCQACNRFFNGDECFNNHLKKLCAVRKYCEKCECEYTKLKKPHRCLEYFCQTCYESYEQSPHYCYLKKLNIDELKKEDQKILIYVSFDIESRIDKMSIYGSYDKHTPDLLVANIVCSNCYDDNSNKKISLCDICGQFEVYFEGDECVKRFCDYLYYDLSNRATENGKVIVFAHNFKGYDGHFVIQDIFERDFFEVKPIQKGTKILKLDVGNVRFIDTYNFFQVPLAALPKEFGFEDIVVKGFFPYKFNKLENKEYSGKIPPFEEFISDRMSEKDKDNVRIWYEDRKLTNYNLREEKLKYCRNDVEILLIAFMSFKKLMIDTSGINPFTRCFTIASMVFEVARALFIKDRQIGITPISGYRPMRNSVMGNVWLDIQQRNFEKKIIREYRIGKYYADGCVFEDGLVFEFLGCVYHGCPQCYTANRNEPLFNNKSPEQLYREWKAKEEYYQKFGFLVCYKWECEFKQQYKDAPIASKKYFDERKLHYSLKKKYGGCDIRGEAFLGGRTNNFRFFYKPKVNEKIKYMDICSSYPNVMKRRRYPVGHPVSIDEDFDNSLESYFGFIKAIVLPPPRLYLPSLPKKLNKKLLFPLCTICAEMKSNISCTHSEKERCLVSTWTVESLKIALSEGYKIIRILHVLHWNDTVTDMFTNQMNTFAKIKLLASGFPVYCKTLEQKLHFIQQIKDYEGIDLEFAKILYCALKRFIGKTGLNSTYGKFGQNANMVQTLVCSDYASLWNILNNDELKVLGVVQRSEKSLTISYQKENIDDCSPGNTSVAIAAMVTDYARIDLLKFMKTVVQNGEDRLLYTDTDSIIYIEKDGDNKLTVGPFIGDLTDEIADKYGSDSRITQMVAAGPKNYAFEVEANGETHAVVKLKGIQQNAKTLCIVNMQKMTSMVHQYVNGNVDVTVNVPQFRIQAVKATHEVKSFDFCKAYRCFSEKRRICGDRNGTVPYGWKGECPY